MFRHRTPAKFAAALLVVAATGCSTNCPRHLTSQDLNEHGLISGSLTYGGFDIGEAKGLPPTASFTLEFRNVASGKTYNIATGRFFDAGLIDEDSARGDVYVKRLPPGDYRFEKCNIYFHQYEPTPGGTKQKTCFIPLTISAPFSVRAGEMQYLGELRFNQGIDLVRDEDPSWLFGPQDKEYLQTSAQHLDSFSRDIGILQSKYPDIAWQDTRRSPNILGESVVQQVASPGR